MNSSKWNLLSQRYRNCLTGWGGTMSMVWDLPSISPAKSPRPFSGISLYNFSFSRMEVRACWTDCLHFSICRQKIGSCESVFMYQFDFAKIEGVLVLHFYCGDAATIFVYMYMCLRRQKLSLHLCNWEYLTWNISELEKLTCLLVLHLMFEAVHSSSCNFLASQVLEFWGTMTVTKDVPLPRSSAKTLVMCSWSSSILEKWKNIQAEILTFGERILGWEKFLSR